MLWRRAPVAARRVPWPRLFRVAVPNTLSGRCLSTSKARLSTTEQEDAIGKAVEQPDIVELIEGRLYRHTKGRWVYNDEQQKAARHTPFSLRQLIQIAARTMGTTGDQFLAVGKLGNEDQNNKAFSITFKNGTEVVARIPTSLVGNTALATASEVATLGYLADHTDVDVPQPLAWSSLSEPNPVGTPFIIMEKTPGVPLSERWPNLHPNQTAATTNDINMMQSRLFTYHNFSQIGSLYFKDDVSPELQARPLYAPDQIDMESDTAKRLKLAEAAEKYRIGPIAAAPWWVGKKLNIEADRGPFPNMAAYIAAAVSLQRAHLDSLTDEEIGKGFQLSSKADIPLLHSHLDKVLEVAPYLVPDQTISATFSLGHPNLTDTNILVRPEDEPKVTSIVDWQAALVAPLVMTAILPDFAQYVGFIPTDEANANKPEEPDWKRMHPQSQRRYRDEYRRAFAEHAYKAMAAGDWQQREPLGYPPEQGLMTAILRCWGDGPFILQLVLVEFFRKWEERYPDGRPCPIYFSPEEIAVHDEETVRFGVRYMQYAVIAAHLGVSPEGWVCNDDYEHVRQLLGVAEAHNWDEQFLEEPFPFKDGRWSNSLV